MIFLSEYNKLISLEVLIGLSVLYLSACYVGKNIMAKRTPVDLGRFPVFYNAFQVILSLYMSWGFFGPQGIKNKFFGLNDEHTRHLEYFVWVHYWSKIVDFVDTVVIVLKKNDRQFSFLHIYHHASIIVIWGLLLHRNVGNGTTAFGAGLNSVIHAIMYTHYLVITLGYQNPFKKYLTTAQLIQFSLCVLHSVLVGLYERSDVQPWWILQFIYQLSMLYLFTRFYSDTYSGRKTENMKEEGKEDMKKKIDSTKKILMSDV